jgi:hypothetical protein
MSGPSGFDTKVTWNGKKVLAEALVKLKRNGEIVGMMLESDVVESLSVGQPTRRSGSGRKARLIGLEPSLPKEPPRVLHGLLRNSISHRTQLHRGIVEVYVGANTKYARALELGGKRSGVLGGLKARPFLRPAVHRNRLKGTNMLVKGLFK